MTVPAIVRQAEVSDAEALADLAEATFREAFGSQNNPEDLELHCAEQFGPSLQRAEIEDDSLSTLLAEVDGGLAGFAQVRHFAPKDCVGGERAAELARIYVRSAYHGRGVAQAIMGGVIEVAKAVGADRLWLGVWEENPRGIAFYRKFGFREVGRHIFQVGNDPQRDLVMARVIE